MLYFESHRDKQTYSHESDNYCPPHFHRSVELLYTLSGEKPVRIGGKSIILRAGDLAILPPYCPHSYERGNASKQLVLTCFADFCPQFEALCKGKVPSSFVYKDDGTLLPLLRELAVTENEILYTGLLNYILGVYTQSVRFVPTETQKEWAFAEAFSSFINEHYAEGLTVASLAKHFGYSPNYFSSVVKQFFGTGVNEYVNAVRVQKSLPMLKKQKIYAVAYECGFNSPQQYHLHFKRFYGCSPKAFLQGNSVKSEKNPKND